MRLLFATVMAVSSMIALSTVTRAEPRSAKDCGSIEESFAYNECIAKFGPSGAGKIASRPPGAVIANAPAAAPIDTPPPTAIVTPARAAAPVARSAPSRVGGIIYQRRANGRYFAVFQVGKPAAPAARVTSPAAAASKRKPAFGGTAKVKTAAVPYSRWRQYRRH